MPDLTFDDFVADLTKLHTEARKFHDKWNGVSSGLVVTAEQQAMLAGIWDQHEAWYDDKITEAKTKK